MTAELVTLRSLYANASTPAGRQAHRWLTDLTENGRPLCTLCPRPEKRRGLCWKCIDQFKADGSLNNRFAPTLRELRIRQWMPLHDQGMNVREAAEQMGESYGALGTALNRAKRAGDERVLSRLGRDGRSRNGRS